MTELTNQQIAAIRKADAVRINLSPKESGGDVLTLVKFPTQSGDPFAANEPREFAIPTGENSIVEREFETPVTSTIQSVARFLKPGDAIGLTTLTDDETGVVIFGFQIVRLRKTGPSAVYHFIVGVAPTVA